MNSDPKILSHVFAIVVMTAVLVFGLLAVNSAGAGSLFAP
jgi:hypothetical protein